MSKVALAFALLLAGAAPASAATILVTGSAASGIPQFDPALGTLKKLTLSLNGSFTVSGMLTLDSANPDVAEGKINGDVSQVFIIGSHEIEEGIGTFSVSRGGLPGETLSFPSDGGNFSNEYVASDPVFLRDFLGRGYTAIDLGMTRVLSTSTENISGSFLSGAASIEEMNVLYDYDQTIAAVPELTTWAMMIGGFGMIGGAMRSARRRKDKVTASYA